MSELELKPPPADFSDQKVGLITCGVIQLVFSLLAMIMTLVTLVGYLITQHLPQPQGSTLSLQAALTGATMYIVFAVLCLIFGIGTIRLKRWARTLILISCLIWICSGIIGMVPMLIFLPDMYSKMSQTGKIPGFMVEIIKIATFFFMFLFYVIIPGSFAFYLSRKSVKETCEFYDQSSPWTEKCPAPVLAVSILLASSMIFITPSLFSGCIYPFFGILLSGLPGFLLIMCTIALLAVLAYGIYKMHPLAWWGTLLMSFIGSISTTITFSVIDMVEMHKKMNTPEQQIKIIQEMGFNQNLSTLTLTTLYSIAFISFLLYTKRYFKKNSCVEPTPS